MLEASLVILEKMHNGQHPGIGTTTVNLGIAYAQSGNLELAAKNLQRAHGIFVHCFGPNHPNSQFAEERLMQVFQMIAEQPEIG